MSVSYSRFVIELYQEHIEEVSFLYEQRLAFHDDPALEWFASYSEEQRLEAHLDALVVGGSVAITVSEKNALEGDAGAIYGLVNLYCRLNQSDTLLETLEQFDLGELDVCHAVQLALLDQMPSEWVGVVNQPSLLANPALFSLFIPALIKHDQLPSVLSCEQMLQGELADPVPLINAVGHLHNTECRNRLAEFIVHGESSVKMAAVVAMLRSGYQQVVSYTQHHVESQAQPLLALASGAPSSFFEGLTTASQNNWTENTLNCIAMGGVAESIPLLLGLLEQEDIAVFAANALFVITGKRLTATHFVEEEWVEEELAGEELADFQQGKMPRRADGELYGEEVEVLSVDSAPWLHWWQHNYTQFISGKRYRFGKLISPVSLTQALTQPFASYALREATYQELLVRYNASVPFSVRDIVSAQKQSLQALYQWATNAEAKVTPGDWYFSGEPQ